MTSDITIPSLRAGAIAAVSSADLDRKVALTRQTHRLWSERTLSLRSPLDPAVPTRPGRPDKPISSPPAR